MNILRSHVDAVRVFWAWKFLHLPSLRALWVRMTAVAWVSKSSSPLHLVIPGSMMSAKSNNYWQQTGLATYTWSHTVFYKKKMFLYKKCVLYNRVFI